MSTLNRTLTGLAVGYEALRGNPALGLQILRQGRFDRLDPQVRAAAASDPRIAAQFGFPIERISGSQPSELSAAGIPEAFAQARGLQVLGPQGTPTALPGPRFQARLPALDPVTAMQQGLATEQLRAFEGSDEIVRRQLAGVPLSGPQLRQFITGVGGAGAGDFRPTISSTGRVSFAARTPRTGEMTFEDATRAVRQAKTAGRSAFVRQIPGTDAFTAVVGPPARRAPSDASQRLAARKRLTTITIAVTANPSQWTPTVRAEVDELSRLAGTPPSQAFTNPDGSFNPNAAAVFDMEQELDGLLGQ